MVTSEQGKSLKRFITTLCPMPAEELDRIAAMATVRQVVKGDFVLRQGEVCRHVFFLTQGFVRMFYVDPDGTEINARFTGENDFFVDFNSFLTQTPSRYYWQAMQDTYVLAFPYQKVQALYRQSPDWNRFGRLMAERVYLTANERVEMLQFLTPEQRYKYVLDRYPALLANISQAHLASFLGIKPESLSRIRHRLKKK